MRGVGLQAAADVLGIVRAARELSLDAASSPTSNPMHFGPIVLFGHGAGAAAVALAAPRVQAEGVVLAGHGGSFLDAVPARRRPASSFDVAPIVLGESPLTASSPVLSLLQNAVEPVDPLVHAASLVLAPATTAKHTLMVYGQGDGFAPAATQVAYALAAGLGVAAPPASVATAEPIAASPLAVPAGANAAGGTVTAIVRQYSAGGGDGHDVVFRDGDAVKDVDRFVADVARGTVPHVGR